MEKNFFGLFGGIFFDIFEKSHCSAARSGSRLFNRLLPLPPLWNK
jgi:hypothetical protein